MCGFLGMGALGGRPPAELRPGLSDVLKHRGPDAFSSFRDGHCLLAHNRLAIIDPNPEANQPFVCPSTGNVLVFNGEIYNYKQLKQKYPALGYTTNSDTEVILKLFELKGPAFVQELNGVFAFVIYHKNARKLYFYRDRLGVKPLYIHHGDQAVYFSSEIKGILHFRPKCGLNYRALYEYLDYGLLEHDEHTLFQGIDKLAPGCYQEVDLSNGNTKQQVYWRVGFYEHSRPKEKEILEQAHWLLDDSTRLNLVSDVEVGLALSSGLDSTLLYILLKKIGAEKLRCFTYGYTEKDYDEIAAVQANPYLKGARLQPVYTRSGDALKSLQEAVHFYEAPLGGVGTLSAYRMMAEVQKAGIKVMLVGEGADEIFGGYKYYHPAFFRDIEHDPARLQHELDCFNRLNGTSYTVSDSGFQKFLAKAVGHQAVMAPDATSLEMPLSSAMLKDRAGVFNEPCAFPRYGSFLKSRMYEDLTVKKLPKLLFFQDRASMAHGVEARVPFLDHRLVEFMYSLPPEFLVRDGRSKYIAQRVLEDLGAPPPRVVKHFMSAPQREWIKKDLYNDIDDLLKGGLVFKSKLVEEAAFKQAYRQYRDQAELGNSFFVWKLVNLEFLFRDFFPHL